MDNCENWTLSELAKAIDTNQDKKDKRIVVPMFQRGERWNTKQEMKFIDSLKRGFPVGTMLFYKKLENNSQTLILVDGLQRSTCIRKYINHPTEFFEITSIPDDLCDKIKESLSVTNTDNVKIKDEIRTFIKAQKDFSNIQYYPLARDIKNILESNVDDLDDCIKVITDFFKTKKDAYDKIAGTVIPVLIYSGNEENLPEIFDRINSQGTPLDVYEVYAAAWPVSTKFKVENSKIVEYVINKYEALNKSGFVIYGYDKGEMSANKELNAFEYLFGLSRYLTNAFPILAFNTKYEDDRVNPLGFELVNACLNDNDKISTLYEPVYKININEFEEDLRQAIDFVDKSIAVITNFKGNNHTKNKIFHPKYLILAMIATTFKQMYEVKSIGDDTIDINPKPTWNSTKEELRMRLLQHYVYDIIVKYWSEGGTGKIYTVIRSEQFLKEISSSLWNNALDSYFAKTFDRSEKKTVINPSKEDYVFLNAIYKDIFTVNDQLSSSKFDVEHIAPKEQMKKLINDCNGEGLPISCIANICYLHQEVNRSKKDKNFYQDNKYLEKVDLKEIEDKYSFTTEEDLLWMDRPYKELGFNELKKDYTDFCESRFKKLKRRFCESLGIQYIESSDNSSQNKDTVNPNDNTQQQNSTSISAVDKNALAQRCIQKLSNISKTDFVHKKGRIYVSSDGQTEIVMATSKAYKQAGNERYWFAYRNNYASDISSCQNKFYVFVCGDVSTMVKLPVEELEKHTKDMAESKDEDGKTTHYHVYLFKEQDGKIKWRLSKIDQEIDVTDFLVK